MNVVRIRASLLAAALGVGLGVSLAWPAPGASQSSVWNPRSGLAVGSEEERYLRVLQLAGVSPSYPWSLRGFTPGEVRRILPGPGAEHPWAGRWDFSHDSLQMDGWGWVEPEARAIFNSAFPFGANDGALWAGKGVTGAIGGGGWARWGPVHVRVGPEAFWSQNADFALIDLGLTGLTAYRDPQPGIDLPQRFGSDPYARVDAGSTEVTAQLGPVTLGAGSAAQWWGPARDNALVLGNNAGGFLHALVQTSAPVDLWVARAHARLTAARLDQSAWSPRQGGEQRRFASAAILVLLPRGLPGLELGASRFTDHVWPEGGPDLRHVLRPFSALANLSGSGVNVRSENQLASAFFRWAFPAAGFEFYGEAMREDFGRDLRHYLVEPDDLLARAFGFQKVWKASAGRLVTLRGESVAAQVHHSERGDRFRDGRRVSNTPRYRHGQVTQGHTQRGQILGSPLVYGGAGWGLGADVYHPAGRWTLELARALRLDWLPKTAVDADPGVADVVYTLKAEAVSFRSGREWRATVAPSLELNRNLEKGNDVFNLNLALSVRGLGR